jgi:hypothetical protein
VLSIARRRWRWDRRVALRDDDCTSEASCAIWRRKTLIAVTAVALTGWPLNTFSGRQIKKIGCAIEIACGPIYFHFSTGYSFAVRF